MKTYSPKDDEIQHAWHVLDAAGQPVGRIAVEAARLLRGKHKPTFTPNRDVGDFVVIINARRVYLSGHKPQQKVYYRHTGYPGGLKQTSFREMLAKSPTRIIEYAVAGMLPKNSLGRATLSKLKVYPDETHPHQAQLAAIAKEAKP